MKNRIWYVALGDISASHAAATIHCLSDVAALQEIGVDATLYTQSSSPDPEDRKGLPIQIVCKNRPLIFRVFFEVLMVMRLLFRKKPDFILFRGYSLWGISFFARVFRIPYGIEVCGLAPHTLTQLLKNEKPAWRDRFVLKHASSIISLMGESLDSIQPYCSESATTVITSVGVDVKQFKASEAGTRGGGASGGPVLAFFGALFQKRGIELVIEALSILREKGIHAEFHVYGSGPARESAGLLASELGIGDAVKFHGYVPSDTLASRLGDVDLSMGLYEPAPSSHLMGINPMKVWTSLAMAKPIVFFNPGRYNIYEGVPGILSCPEATAESVADVIARNWEQLGREGLRKSGLEGLAYVEQKMTWKNHAQDIWAAIAPHIQ